MYTLIFKTISEIRVERFNEMLHDFVIYSILGENRENLVKDEL